MLSTTLLLALLAAPVDPPPVDTTDSMSAIGIIERTYEHAGGDQWVNPRSLLMEGYGLFWQDSERFVRYEPYRMWRVYPQVKDDAHSADGRVRIEAMNGGNLVFQIAFDGTDTYSQDGRLEDRADSDRWASNFGFGVIRHALDDGYTVKRLPDDYVDGAPAYTVRITDATGGTTLFNIRQHDFAIVSVDFETPRGWHQRVNSDFFRNAEGAWLQPGRVRLFYNGVKANEIYWTKFKTGEQYPIEIFQLGD